MAIVIVSDTFKRFFARTWSESVSEGLRMGLLQREDKVELGAPRTYTRVVCAFDNIT